VSSARAQRVDALRVALIGGVVVFHATRPFDPFDFYVKADTEVEALALAVLFVGLWGMPLFFVLAGAAAWHSLGRRGARAFARERVVRLLVPFVAGVVLLVPPQLHAGALARGHHPSYVETLRDFFDVHWSWELPIPVDGEVFEPAHLWFVAYLFVFTLMLLPLLHAIRRGGCRRALGWFEARPLTSMLALGLTVVLAEAALGIEDAGGWNRWAYPPFLLLGFLLVARPTLAERVASRWRILAAAGLLSYLVLVATVDALHDRLGDALLTGGDPAAIAWRAGQGGAGWLLVLAAAGVVLRQAPVGSRTRERRGDGPWHQWAREGVLPVYMVHQTVAVVLAAWILSWPVAAGVQWAVLTALTLTCSLALYDLLRRVRLARILMGMRQSAGSSADSHAPHSARAVAGRVGGLDLDREPETPGEPGAEPARDLQPHPVRAAGGVP
jgi:glucans biosynthesis protein C